jgi:ribosomal protein S18 acetylase RimI-like enzyme
MGGYLKLLAVLPPFQNQGLGRRLLAEMENVVCGHTRHVFALVSGFNSRAQRFYANNGYRQVGAIPGLVRADVTEQIYYKNLTAG